jgi:hypothetical protein
MKEEEEEVEEADSQPAREYALNLTKKSLGEFSGEFSWSVGDFLQQHLVTPFFNQDATPRRSFYPG